MTEAMSNHEEAVRGKNETLCRNVWDTSYVSKADSFGYFREGICQSFLALTPERPLGRVFKARVEKTNLQGGWIGRIDVTPHLVRRTVSDKSTLPGDYMHLCMKLIGSSRIDVDGKVFKQRMGDAVLMDVASIKSFDLEPGKRTRSVNVIFEKIG